MLGDNPNNLQSLDQLTKAGVNVLTYGNFLTIFINFIILAWVVFLMVKVMNRMRKQKAQRQQPQRLHLKKIFNYYVKLETL